MTESSRDKNMFIKNNLWFTSRKTGCKYLIDMIEMNSSERLSYIQNK